VKQQVGDVVPGGVAQVALLVQLPAENLAIGHVREPSERMPVALLEGSEGVADAVPRQFVLHVEVLRHITGVVEVDEIEVPDAPIGGHGDRDQGQRDCGANQPGAALGCGDDRREESRVAAGEIRAGIGPLGRARAGCGGQESVAYIHSLAQQPRPVVCRVAPFAAGKPLARAHFANV
jgi:hypothetical protein